jgi:hypothetical protein
MAEQTAPEQPNAHVPREGWIIIYWDATAGTWATGLGLYADRGEAAAMAGVYRRELGTKRAGMIHTSDRE